MVGYRSKNKNIDSYLEMKCSVIVILIEKQIDDSDSLLKYINL